MMDDNFGNLKDEYKNPKNRMSFEYRLDEQKKLIDKLSIVDLKMLRIRLKRWLDNVDIILKDEDVITNDNKRKYFIELRKRVIKPSLAYSKQKLKLINKVLNNGTNANQAKRFVNIAAEILPAETFQKIYGFSMMKEEIELQQIKEIKDFMIKCKYEKNGNF